MLKIISVVSIIFLLGLSGCVGQGKYYEAVTSQNVEIHRMNMEAKAEERKDDIAHEEKMTTLMGKSMTAAALTPDKTDDVLVPLMFASIEDKRVMAKALTAKSTNDVPFQSIKAPDSFGDTIQKAGGTILGVGGIVLGISQSSNMKDIAVAGINGAGTRNIGSTVTTQGNDSIYSQDILPVTENPLDENGMPIESGYQPIINDSTDSQSMIDEFISNTQ